jgi:hypothetical protein
MSNIIIEHIPLDDVIDDMHGHERFNSNNHWKTYDDRPDDYYEVLARGNANNWIPLFHPVESYHTITLDRKDIVWMSKAHEIGRQTQRFSKLYEDDMEELLSKHSFSGTSYFVRTKYNSLKYGQHGVGPYEDLRSIIESMTSSNDTHRCFEYDDEECVIYLLPWQDIVTDKEFRIFVNNNKITAISQQHLYTPNKWLQNITDETERNTEITKTVNKINNYFNEVGSIRDKLASIGNTSYVMDFVFTTTGKPYFIEVNSFGKEYASGSSLFHWLLDTDALYGSKLDNSIYFRYTF